MIAVAVIFLGAVIAVLVVRAVRTGREGARAAPAAQSAGGAVRGTPGAVRLLGLLVLALAILLLAWLHLGKMRQFTLMTNLIYPACLGGALMLLFDKAARAWNVKSAAESVREWLWCDTIVFLLLLGFLNLVQANPGEKYNVFFWDMLYVALFFFTFWMVDRKITRLRFLVAYGYLVLAPILLLIWRAVLDVPAPAEFSFWQSQWPEFAWALIFLVLEIIIVVASETEQQIVGLVKDIAFFVGYGVLLIVAS